LSQEAGELLRVLGRPELRRLWTEARGRVEQLGSPRGTVLFTGASEAERRAVADLLGLPKVPTGALRIRLDHLDRILRASRFAVDLRTALELLDGPLRDHVGERAEERYRRQRLWAAADRWGPSCPPLICLEGFPSYAAQTLLAQLACQGAVFLYHGDFDWDGLRIANKLREIVPFRPWRFTTADYKAALAVGGERPALHSRRSVALWDADLGRALLEADAAVEEETVLGELLDDLAGERH
jgi:hypothetical protein